MDGNGKTKEKGIKKEGREQHVLRENVQPSPRRKRTEGEAARVVRSALGREDRLRERQALGRLESRPSVWGGEPHGLRRLWRTASAKAAVQLIDALGLQHVHSLRCGGMVEPAAGLIVTARSYDVVYTP